MLETQHPPPATDSPPPPRRRRLWLLSGLVLLGLVLVLGATLTSSPSSTSTAGSRNPDLDLGTPLNRPAPGFTLTDQFGHPVSLRSFRGRVVILAFNDSECTTICPLTTTAMLDAKRSLGAAGSRVQLLGVDANPKATSTADVLRYSRLHGMLRAWHFLTGPLPQLKRVWRQYGIGVEIERGQIDHTPALFMIDPAGRLRRVYLTQSSYAAIPQLGQVLAQEASNLLPGHPRVRRSYSYAPIRGIGPARPYTLPRLGGGSVKLGSGSPHLYLFFATWDRQVSNLAGQLEALGRYQQAAVGSSKLPPLTGIDEGSVEPSRAAAASFVAHLPHPLSYPVAIDSSGRVADGYGVQDEPWLVLTASGRIAWYRDISTSGWPTVADLQAAVRAALSRPAPANGSAGARSSLAGSPGPLAALHEQASRLLGGGASALSARVRALRGYPIVVNVWASWCTACRSEFGLLASAAARYGRQVAFLGADAGDSSADAQAFLRRHRVSYPSYALPLQDIRAVLPQGVVGLPTTFFINPSGRVVSVHSGQYVSQGTLDQDIQTFSLGH